MFIIVIVGIALVVLASSLVFLVEFARLSRRDTLYYPAASPGAGFARKVCGMYTRGTGELPPYQERISIG